MSFSELYCKNHDFTTGHTFSEKWTHTHTHTHTYIYIYIYIYIYMIFSFFNYLLHVYSSYHMFMSYTKQEC